MMFFVYIGAPMLSALLCAIFFVFGSEEIGVKPITIQNYMVNRITSGLRWIPLFLLPISIAILFAIKVSSSAGYIFLVNFALFSLVLVEIIAATCVSRGKMRKELYYKILEAARKQSPNFDDNKELKREIYMIINKVDYVDVENDHNRDYFYERAVEKIYQICKKYDSTLV